MKKDVNTRVVEAIDAILKNDPNLTKGVFARSIGISSSKLSEILGKRMYAGTDVIAAMCSDYSISSQWLLTGEGNMFATSNNEMAPELSGVPGRIPLIPLTAFAGYGEMSYNDIPVEEYYTIKEFRNADFLLRVKGDSMAPLFNSGDIIACKYVKDLTFWQWHCVYAIATKNQGVLIKRVEKGNNDGDVTLVSENMNYDPFNLPKKEIDAVALVLGAIVLL